MKKLSLIIVVMLSALFCATPAVQALELSPMFADNMVLQREKAVPVWGWAKSGSEVAVTFAGKTVKAKADSKGYWYAKLKPMKANKQPQTMSIEGDGEKKAINNVLVGEVWFCSGQSNMEFTVGPTKDIIGGTLMPAHIDPEKLPVIRHIKIKRQGAKTLDRKAPTYGGWKVCNKENIDHFTAVGFFFAERLVKEINVPVGLVEATWGGFNIEPFIPVEGYDVMKNYDEKWDPGPKNYSDLYNGMVATVIPYAIRGTIWYQGESNIHEGEVYFYKMKALIEGWRKVWGQPPSPGSGVPWGEFPFYYCQLSSYGNWTSPAGGEGWALPREAQRLALAIKNTGMAVLCDIGNKKDVHPKNKFDAGNRLALWALAKDYGKKDLVYSGPLYKSVEFKDGKAIVSFDHAKGLKAAKKKSPQDMGDPLPAGRLQGFSIAGPNKHFHWADAKIDGDKVIVSSGRVKNPAAVRYIYNTTVHQGNLYNGANLPASPFITDNDWKCVTEVNKAAAKLKAADAEMREFTSKKGTKINAKLLKFKGGKVYLVTEAGKNIEIRLTALSKEDVEYIKRFE
ncbi:MAG: hypothetical protein ISS35_03590 [Kiritimatiellae bacterium]|nr:hypothetical protein [Kiritimatiellia bacterium]